MGANSKIEWCHHTFNYWWGCIEVSPACDFCYAREFAKRFGFAVWGKEAPRRFFGHEHWREPVKWDRRAAKLGERHRVFCGSMMDVMEHRPDLPELDAARARGFELVEQTPNLDWLFLTKRPQEYARLLPESWLQNPRPNVWLLTTVESQQYLWRAEVLAGTPAVVRGISYEPALGAVDFTRLLERKLIHWIIAGGESGHNARLSEADWFRAVRDQCAASGVAFFFKQWGDWPRGLLTNLGRELDGREWSQFPEVGRWAA
jgi:protein gp37